MIEEGLVSYLLANGGVAAMIGNRLHDLVLPQNPTLPAIVWQRVSSMPEYTQEGQSKLASGRFQFACWAKTTLEALRVAGALREALSGYAGQMGGEHCHAAFLLDGRDLIDPETGLRRCLSDFKIWYEEA